MSSLNILTTIVWLDGWSWSGFYCLAVSGTRGGRPGPGRGERALELEASGSGSAWERADEAALAEAEALEALDAARDDATVDLTEPADVVDLTQD